MFLLFLICALYVGFLSQLCPNYFSWMPDLTLLLSQTERKEEAVNMPVSGANFAIQWFCLSVLRWPWFLQSTILIVKSNTWVWRIFTPSAKAFTSYGNFVLHLLIESSKLIAFINALTQPEVLANLLISGWMTKQRFLECPFTKGERV